MYICIYIYIYIIYINMYIYAHRFIHAKNCHRCSVDFLLKWMRICYRIYTCIYIRKCSLREVQRVLEHSDIYADKTFMVCIHIHTRVYT